MALTLSCEKCKTEYDAFSVPTKQAYGCSTSLRNGVLQGEFGSLKFDGVRFQVVARDLEDDMCVCDNCIETMMKTGEIILIAD